MSLLPHVLYTVNCNGCSVPYRFICGDGELEDVLFDDRAIPPHWSELIVRDGWVLSRRHLCPACADTECDALVEVLMSESAAGPAVGRPGGGEAD